MNFEEVLMNRSSIRAFKSEQIEDSQIHHIIEQTVSAPSAGNLQAYKIHIIRCKQVLKELSDASTGADFIYKSAIAFVFIALPEESAKEYGKRGKELYALQDATIAASYCQLAITNQNLSSVWVGAFNTEAVSNILKLSKNEIPIAIIPAGKANEIAYPTSRKSIEKTIKWVE
ncbi:MAG: nitroreductase family protein [Vampirovibrionia bacterium]